MGMALASNGYLNIDPVDKQQSLELVMNETANEVLGIKQHTHQDCFNKIMKTDENYSMTSIKLLFTCKINPTPLKWN